MDVIDAIGHALALAGSMGWKILWALVLGFVLSAVVESAVSKETVSRLLGDDRPRTLATAAGLGAASSSCSYASVALARSLFRKGADFTAAIAFEVASTNLVIELGILLALLIGWQFTAAEVVGGVLMIVLVAAAFRAVMSEEVVDEAREQAARGVAGRMEGHAAMDMSAEAEEGVVRRALSPAGRAAVARLFVMNWASVWTDIVLGLVIAGTVGAWVPKTFWRHLFLTDHGALQQVWGPIVGPLIAVASFVCSVGNVPLAAVLWNSGISFGGVVSFLFADLVIVPILLIYRKYYGTRMTVRLSVTLLGCMAIAGGVVGAVFSLLGIASTSGSAHEIEASVGWDYTTFLDIAALVLATTLVTKFVRDGGWAMIGRMGGAPTDER